jgi:hypothetical protein
MREAAVHYDHCVDLLRTELVIAPPTAMTTLIKDVWLPPSAGREPVVALSPVVKQLSDRPRHNLPTLYNQFLDRVTAQQDIGARLDQPWCRLVTIMGQGGVGKTRLATTVARSRLDHYQDGVRLVELADSDRDDDDLAEAIDVEIATAVDLRLSGSAKPVEQVLGYLQIT